MLLSERLCSLYISVLKGKVKQGGRRESCVGGGEGRVVVPLHPRVAYASEERDRPLNAVSLSQ